MAATLKERILDNSDEIQKLALAATRTTGPIIAGPKDFDKNFDKGWNKDGH